MKYLITFLFSLSLITLNAQGKILTKQQINDDLEFIAKTLNEKSSYIYLNGYDFSKDFENYQQTVGDSVRLEDFGQFLTKTIGKIGDRHSSVRDYEVNDSVFLPYIYAPESGRVVVLQRNAGKALDILNPKFPYLKKINGIAIEDFLKKILPGDVTAPIDAYFTRAVRELRDIQKIYAISGRSSPANIEFTLSDRSLKSDTVLTVATVAKSKRSGYWDESLERQYLLVKDEDYNKPEVFNKLFNIRDGIAYIHIPVMVSREDAPLFFDKLNSFMRSALTNSKALIVDVRGNGGGTRDLTYELAKYLVHPDSIYVVNTTKQRAPLPLQKEIRESLHSRNLYSFSELDAREQRSAARFLKTFKPMYALDDKKYSEYYFGLFNGKKLSEQSFFYNKPVYILANEKSFSAASVLVAAFKGIPHINIAGITTDGSSGNSDRFELPNSNLRIRISTMISFQKDGKILDGVGTEPDIKIERDLQQVLWRSDTQLEKLKSIILEK